MRRTLFVLLAFFVVIGACSSGEEPTTTTEAAIAGDTTTTTSLPPVLVDQAVWPLTGLPTDGVDATTAPVLIVKIDNTESSRPQSGLVGADVVFDVLVEGGVSRLIAVYQSNVPDEIGPVRSAREVDPKLIEPFGALFSYSGGQDFVVTRIRSVATDVGFPRLGDAAYDRSADRPAPYDVILRTADVLETESLGLPTALLFGDLPDGDGEPATEINLSLSSLNEVGYVYADGTYERSVGGQPHLDITDEQVTATNVAVVFVDQLPTGRTDSSGSPVPDYDVVGSGTAAVFRDGKVIEGTWQRSTTADLFAFLDDNGNQIPLAPGTTWIEIVPNGRPASWN